MRSICEGCDLDPEQLYLLQGVPPVCFYKAQDGVVQEVVTVYMAMTNDPPPEDGTPDECQDEEDEDDSYDWFLYRYAIAALRSEEERDAMSAAAEVRSLEHFRWTIVHMTLCTLEGLSARGQGGGSAATLGFGDIWGGWRPGYGTRVRRS
jgi:hypothetical protein